MTLLALALDPVFQQVTDFPERWAYRGNGSIPRVVGYKPDGLNFFRLDVNGTRLSDLDRSTYWVMQRFWYDNRASQLPPGRAEIPIDCPTNSCTWPDYDTLAICSACTGITPLLTFNCRTASTDWTTNKTIATSAHQKALMCGYFINATSDSAVLMSGYMLEPTAEGMVPGEVLLSRALPLTTMDWEPLFGSGSINFRHIRGQINDFITVGAANGEASVYRNETPVAHECVMHWCVQTLRSKFSWGFYEEETLKTTLNTTTGPRPWPWKTEPSSSGLYRGTTKQIDDFEAPTIDTFTADGHKITYGLLSLTAIQVAFSADEYLLSSISATNETKMRFRNHRAPEPAMTRAVEHNP